MHPALNNADILSLLVREVYNNSTHASHQKVGAPPTLRTLKNLSLVSKGFRNVALPLLFRHITIHHSERADAWQRSEREVDELLTFRDLEKLAQICRCFQFTVRLDWYYEDKAENISAPSGQFPQKLAKLVASLQNLEELTFDIFERDPSAFEDAFKDANFPHIKILQVGPHCHFLLPHCPNVQSVRNARNVTGRRSENQRLAFVALINSCANMPKITSLKLVEWFSLEFIQRAHAFSQTSSD
ncbi:hypothetical protein BT69DRAFT_1285732 [Atractiella rhizophila]|nr:hypothetical protein BT69DRAFT_1285732 [Atractiella rhizophila]